MATPNRPKKDESVPVAQSEKVIPEARNDRISHAVLFDVLTNQTSPDALARIIYDGLNGDGSAKKDKKDFKAFAKELEREFKDAIAEERQQIILRYTDAILQEAANNPSSALSLGKTILASSNVPKPLQDNFSKTAGALGGIRISLAEVLFSGTSSAFFSVLSIVIGALSGITLSRETTTEVQKVLATTVKDIHHEFKDNGKVSSSAAEKKRDLSEDGLKKLHEQFRNSLLEALNDLAEQKRRANKKDNEDVSFESSWKEENRKRNLVVETNFVIREAVILLMAENNEKVLRTLEIIAERLKQFNFLNTTFHSKKGVLDIMQIANEDGFALVS